MLFQFIKGELKHFNSLSQSSRHLLLSFVAFEIAAPLLSIFTSAFIWRHSQDLFLVATYQLAWIVGLSTGFIINAFLLKKFFISKIYAAGLVLQAAANVVLFAITELNIVKLLFLGIFLGVMAGLYWSNRNVLTLQVTESKERNYFCSLESSLATFFSAVTPFIFGLFIEAGEWSTTIDVNSRYQILMLAVMTIQILGALGILKSKFSHSTPTSLLIQKPSELWKQARIFMTIQGAMDGVTGFMPTLIILILAGKEAAVGTLQSLGLIFSAGLLYFIARWMNIKRRFSVLVAGILVTIAGGLVVAVWYSSIGGMTYMLLQSIGLHLIWAAASPMLLDTINADTCNHQEHYRHVLDREIFLNFGRIIGITFLLSLLSYAGQDFSLQVTPIVVGLLLSALLFKARKIVFIGT